MSTMPSCRHSAASTATPAAPFTLIELLVVIAIISVLASMLLPVLGKARNKATHASCIGQLRQNGVAHASYQGDYEDFFPDFGGIVTDIGAGRLGSPQLRLNKMHTNGGGAQYFTEYLGSRFGTKQYQLAPLAFCPAGGWSGLGYYINDNPASLRYNNALNAGGTAGYFYYAGRKMLYSTHSNADTQNRRTDPRELLMTDSVGTSDRNETGSNYQRYSSWKSNPHEGQDCKPALTGQIHQMTADGSVGTFEASSLNKTVTWGTANYAKTQAVSIAQSEQDGTYFRSAPF